MNKRFVLFVYIMLFVWVFAVGFRSETKTAHPEEQFKHIVKRIRKNPQDVYSINALGILYAEAGQHNDALRTWSYALRIEPENAHLYNNIASALKEIGRTEEALLWFERGSQVAPSHVLYYNYGLLLLESGDRKAAAESFRQALGIAPGFKAASDKLNSLGSETSFTHTGSVPAKSFGRALEKDRKSLVEENELPLPAASEISEKSLSIDDCIKIIKSFKTDENYKFIALTFDDGPHKNLTPQLLDLLAKERVKATFFIVGQRAKAHPKIIKRMALEGHDIENHTWEHISLAKNSEYAAIESIDKTDRLIYSLTGKHTKAVRPPYGASGKKVRNLLGNYGYYEVLWDTDSRDWENKNPAVILRKVMRSIKPGHIVLFHDIHPGAVAALPVLIKAFKACGYRFVTISELIEMSDFGNLAANTSKAYTAEQAYR